MIALNKIIENKEYFNSKYKLMGKHVNLDKIIELEQKYIIKDRENNNARAHCNKLCSEVAHIVEGGGNPKELVNKISKLDKQINKTNRKLDRFMNKIDRKLKRLPNVALENNVLNLPIKTQVDVNFNSYDFERILQQIGKFEKSSFSSKAYLKSLKKVVFKKECLPKVVLTKDCYLIIFAENSLDTFNLLSETLKNHSKFLIDKSIKYLKKDCSKEHIAKLDSGSIINLDYIGDYISRDIGLKFYSKESDMTKFAELIRVNIK